MIVFVPKQFDIKLNFYCNEIKFKLNWQICANTTEAVKNFDVIKKCHHKEGALVPSLQNDEMLH